MRDRASDIAARSGDDRRAAVAGLSDAQFKEAEESLAAGQGLPPEFEEARSLMPGGVMGGVFGSGSIGKIAVRGGVTSSAVTVTTSMGPSEIPKGHKPRVAVEYPECDVSPIRP